MSYERIPPDIKAYSQWINWRYEWITNDKGEKKLTKIPVRSIDSRAASVTNPLDWTDFNTAVTATALHTYRLRGDEINRSFGLGFVFTKSDPYCGTDLDNPDGNIDILQRQQAVLESLDSYSERSPSGFGLHIITKAQLTGNGRRRNKIECYDALRFFTFTGDVYRDTPIRERQEQTLELYNSLGSHVTEIAHTGYEAESYTDAEVCEKACAAHNGEKFKRLWLGDWRTDYGHQSQSEADFALVNIIAFYSRNLGQTIRVFRQSVLGQRDKAKRGEYVGRMAKRAFDRMTPQVTIAAEAGEMWFDARTIEPWNAKVSLTLALPKYEPQAWAGAQVEIYQPAATALSVGYSGNDPGRPLDFPDPTPPPDIPGLVGLLVQQAWHAAPFQVAEVAVASALSTMSLLCSRTYRHGTLGLSLYLLVLAATSTGKSFGYKANDYWHAALLKFYTDLRPPHHLQGKARAELLEQMIMGEIGSAQGLAQHMPKAPATLFHADEYVDAIVEMARPMPSPHMAQIKSELLRLMEMSGPGRVYRGRKYSNRSSTAQESVNVYMASLSILATGVPSKFYNAMSNDLLESGFLPRFTILEYEGGLTKRNDKVRTTLDPAMMKGLMQIFDKAFDIGLVLSGDDTPVIDVQPKDAAAATRLEWFENVCYREIQSANDRNLPTAGLWSRAKEHVRQIASLIAVGCNAHMPTIDASYVDIAIGIVRPTLDKIASKVAGGDTGTGDDRLDAEIKKVMVRMLAGKMNGYPMVKPKFVKQGFLPICAIRNCALRLGPFKTHRLGASNAFETSFNGMVKYGTIKLVDVDGVKCCQAVLEHFQNG